MANGRIPIITNYASTDLIHIKVDPYGGAPSSQAAPVSGFFGNIPAGVNVGLGTAAADGWGINQLWYTGSPPTNYNCGGLNSTIAPNWATDNNNDAYGVKTEILLNTGTPVGGYPSSDITAVWGLARNYGATSELDKIYGGNFAARQYGEDVGEIYAIMAQAASVNSRSADTTKITGVYTDAYTTISTGAVAVGTLYGVELRTFSKTTGAGATSAVTTAYGIHSAVFCNQFAGSVASIDTAYNVYLTDLHAGAITYGPVTNYYGLYIAEPTKATNNWAIYSEGRHHFDQPTNDAAVPVLALDQADLSEGFIDYLGTSAASAVGPITSWTTGNTIQGFVRVEINGAAFWMPYYDAPTS